MANLKEVRTRISSVSSTQQITSAMKMVSAAKFRRAQNAIIGMRPYAAQLNEIVADIDTGDGVQTPFHAVRPVQTVVLVVVTSNKGLCGAFNSNVLKLAQQRIDHWRQAGAAIRIVSVGKKASELLARQKDLQVSAHDELLDSPAFDAVATLADTLMDDFVEKRIDRVEMVYNQFKNSLSQVLTCEPWLPVSPKDLKAPKDTKGAKKANDYIFEPSKEDILREMLPLTLRSTFYRAVLDSLAAEHGARMTAMQKATDNATELLKDLRLSYNKARQASITNEIIEIVSGSEALKG
ncbi:MAG: ATP synthase F1 subunit gamma [Bacteroidales bacterium]|nr:ATP synthase F1 subunit gamma [Bacteroidales bacterium]